MSTTTAQRPRLPNGRLMAKAPKACEVCTHWRPVGDSGLLGACTTLGVITALNLSCWDFRRKRSQINKDNYDA